jgi:SAM-dependent methyltransferase
MTKNNSIQEQVQKFYNQRPYPPPVKDLDDYRQRWEDEGHRHADFHLHWPHQPYREDLSILVAGCGTSQAAKHALRNPTAQVVGIDLSPTSIRHTKELKRKHKLENLQVHQLPVEQAAELGARFDKIICTGVLHHLPGPDAGLCALREVLEPEGALHLMVYAVYGRYGVYMLQEYVRLLGVGDSDEEISDFANTLMALPQDHPLARLLGTSPDFRTKAGLADALLNPQDRAYTVPQLLDFVERCGLRFGRWVRQAPYLPQCGGLAETPHAARLTQLPQPEQYAAAELFRGTMLRHSLIVYRDDCPGDSQPIRFDDDRWPVYVPIRLPETISVQKQLPPGAAAVLINQAHTYPDLFLPIDAQEKQWYDGIDGRRTIVQIIRSTTSDDSHQRHRERAQAFFERLWWYDQVEFDASRQGSETGVPA